jgi:hypothetical protein
MLIVSLIQLGLTKHLPPTMNTIRETQCKFDDKNNSSSSSIFTGAISILFVLCLLEVVLKQDNDGAGLQ